MGLQIANNHSPVMMAQIIFLLLFMFPDLSLILWKSLIRKWAMTRGKLILKRNKTAGEKLKKYWEIDMRKFR